MKTNEIKGFGKYNLPSIQNCFNALFDTSYKAYSKVIWNNTSFLTQKTFLYPFITCSQYLGQNIEQISCPQGIEYYHLTIT